MNGKFGDMPLKPKIRKHCSDVRVRREVGFG